MDKQNIFSTKHALKGKRTCQSLSSCKEGDKFNLDETGLFYKYMSNETMMFENKTLSRGLSRKESLMHALRTNTTNIGNFFLLVTGKYTHFQKLSTKM